MGVLLHFVLPVLQWAGFGQLITADADQPAMNPTSRLYLVETVTVWKSPDNQTSARQARFSGDESRVAWIVSSGEIMVYDLSADRTTTVWKPVSRGEVEEITWGPTNILAACVRLDNGEKSERCIVLWAADGNSRLLKNTSGAKTVAWREDGHALAFAADDGLYHYDLELGQTVKLADSEQGWRPERAPAHEDLQFVGKLVAARISGTMRWILAGLGSPTIQLGECRGLVPDMERKRLYLVPWLAGPTKISRGAGVAWVEMEPLVAGLHSPANKSVLQPERHILVPFAPGGPYWLVDVWDWHYPTTLRVTADGRHVRFIGVRADVLAETPWREMCLWEVPADGSVLPVPVVKLGAPLKRLDVGNTHAIGWRPAFENDVILVDLTGRRAWRLPDGLNLQRDNTDVATGRLLIAAARGNDVVLIRLKE
ncbi:MAG: hypothetical protein N2255_07520 [Kiritimatiellae bacterium]|nr:hypothetical protein [Kiritimatiellia bacterium]